MKLEIEAADGQANLSPPARGRGLKHIKLLFEHRLSRSPPARGRGLKHLWKRVCDYIRDGRPPRGGVD